MTPVKQDLAGVYLHRERGEISCEVRTRRLDVDSKKIWTMTEDELDRIRKSFVRAKECSTEVACLATVIRYYGGEVNLEELTRWTVPVPEENRRSLGAMQHAATCAGLTAHMQQLDMNYLSQMRSPMILLAEDDYGIVDYVVCYGLHEGRYIVWEPRFGPMQYWPNEMKTLWVMGICMRLYPTEEFWKKADFHLKWWEVYAWSRRWKRKLDHMRDFVELEILPRFRW